MTKKIIIGVVVLLLITIFFFPKSYGGGSGTGSSYCKCLGWEREWLGGKIIGSWHTTCYGLLYSCRYETYK